MGIKAAKIIKYAETDKYTIDCRKRITSTNTVLIEMAKKSAPDMTVLVAESQTNGRGRFDRSFYSPDKTGVYFSLLLRDGSIPSNLTPSMAVAVALALEEFTEKHVKIKWVNDIYIDDRKVCGILAESSFNTTIERIDYAVIGVGINVFKPLEAFPDEIKNRAGFVVENNDFDILNKVIGRVLFYCDRVFSEYTKDEVISEYRNRSILLKRKVDVIEMNETYSATVLDIDDDFNLVVLTDKGEKKQLLSGEISIKL